MYGKVYRGMLVYTVEYIEYIKLQLHENLGVIENIFSSIWLLLIMLAMISNRVQFVK